MSMSPQNELITGQMALMVLERWGALPTVKLVAGAFQINIKHAPTGNTFSQRHMSLHTLFSEYYCWRLAEQRLIEAKERGREHAAA